MPPVYPTLGSIVREHPLLDELIPPDARVEVLASGFKWAEGPLWVPHRVHSPLSTPKPFAAHEAEPLVQGRVIGRDDLARARETAQRTGEDLAEVLVRDHGVSRMQVLQATAFLHNVRGFVLFSDIPRNSIMTWTEDEGLAVFLKPSGYTGVARYGKEPGSNGLTLDPEGRLVACEHGDRRVSLMAWDGGKRTLADSYHGKRLNSPNDAVYRSNGDLYFTDPPYGLPGNFDDPRRELDFCGVFRVTPGGEITLLTAELSRPNGLAFSPDERTLYVANSDPERAVWMAYPMREDGTLGAGEVFQDVTDMVGDLPGLPDGLKVDRRGTLFATAPGGIHVYTPDGTRLGRIDTGLATANCAWGNDGSVLYITAHQYLCRLRTSTLAAAWAA
jgi:gluconolactonase